MPSPAVVDDHRVIDHIEVPVVIAVGPGTATVELGAGTQFTFSEDDFPQDEDDTANETAPEEA